MRHNTFRRNVRCEERIRPSAPEDWHWLGPVWVDRYRFGGAPIIP